MDIKQRQLLKKYTDIILKQWRLLGLILLVSVTVGLGYYFYVPKIYESTALLSYEQQQISPGKMDPEQGRSRLQESLATLRELVTSRNSLEKVIVQFSLYEEARKRLPIEDVIENMRKNITIQPASRGDIFSVSFQGADPQKVTKVANNLASLFIEENLKYREERASETSKYTQSELVSSKKVLDEKEQQMRDYKLKYFNEMPEQRQSNLTQLQTLIQQNQGIQNSIQELERTKVMLQEQAGFQQRLTALRRTNEPTGGSNSTVGQPENEMERLQRLRLYLEELKGKYTDNHPEVRRIRQLIEQGEKKGPSVTPTENASASNKSQMVASIEGQKLNAQIKQIDINISQLREELAAMPAQIAKYQRWIEAVPSREAEWTSLTRDYNELRRHYDQLVAQNLQAQSVENLERNQKGSKFKIVDSARVPEKPSKPNFIKMLLVAVALGMGVGFGGVLLFDFIDTTFKDVGELEEYVGVPVICAIPFVDKEADTKKEKLIFRISCAMLSLYAVALLAVIAIMWKKGMIIV